MYQIRIENRYEREGTPNYVTEIARHENHRRACEVAAAWWVAALVTCHAPTFDAREWIRDARMSVWSGLPADAPEGHIRAATIAALRGWQEDAFASYGTREMPDSQDVIITVVEIAEG